MSRRTPGAPSAEVRPLGPFTPASPADAPFFLSASLVGRERLPRQVVVESHRTRIIGGALSCMAREGAHETSIARILAACETTRRTFEECFGDKEECLLAAYDRSIAWLAEGVTGALRPGAAWPEQVARATETAFGLLAEDPGAARLICAEILCLGPEGQGRRALLTGRLEALLRAGREADPGSPAPVAKLEPALAHGVLAVLEREVCEGRAEDLTALAPTITEFVLEPYVGTATARRVARTGRRPSGR
jgi:AcrR family transcriptional regulator